MATARSGSSSAADSSRGAAMTHASAGTRPAWQRAATTTSGMSTATNAAKATASGAGAWIAEHAIAWMHSVGAIGPLVRPVVKPRTAAIVDRRASVHRAVRGAADLGEDRTGRYQRRS
jgi:hypothetical protein